MKWILDDKNVFIVCHEEEKWIKLFKNMLKGYQTSFIIDDCSAELWSLKAWVQNLMEIGITNPVYMIFSLLP